MATYLVTRDSTTQDEIVVGDDLVSSAAIAQGRNGGDPDHDIRSALDCLLSYSQSEIGFEKTASIAIDALFQANLRIPHSR